MTFPDPAEVLPHSPPAVLVERVLAFDGDTVVCLARIGADSPFVSDGRAPALVALEMAAQAAAMLPQRGDGTVGPLRSGYLVRVRDVTLSRADLPAGAALVVTARRTDATGPLGVFAVDVRLDGEPVLAGTLATMRAHGGP